MAVLRQQCPWDSQQTHRSLVPYLVEESLEVVEAIETGDRDHLCEELGDLLLQVVFHAEIARESADGFDLEQVAAGIADKLVARHPHVFGPATARVDVAELNVTWEQRKAVEKGRTSVLDGIPDQLSALAKATKIISRARSRSVDVTMPAKPIEPAELGEQVLELVARAQSSGFDAEQAVRDAVRRLEATVLAAEAAARP
ncbi:MAG TPA: MazG family protein [Propionibacteriaceae bacterium]|nr:MazG family protein [Propionibacteriaceae bacterium]